MEYSLFLDDLRAVDMIYPGQSTRFLLVRSYDAFVDCIQKNGLPSFISFDNDLGEDENGELLPDGYACAKWLVFESGLDLRELRFYVYSANPVAKVQIESLLRNYLRFLNE
ncbi:MAG: cyclic-phosphate processing receiver domain-containing protein [Arcticibacter sp.]